jgi:FtsP/CotA-like multicopper oxidase with cupredoxin domain
VTVFVYGASFRVLAVDARDVHEPQLVRAKSISLPGGGRLDLAVTVPADGTAARLDVGAGAGTMLAVGPRVGSLAPIRAIDGSIDFLSYGTPTSLGFSPQAADRNFVYEIGRRYGFLDGRLGNWWTVNGRLSPDVPMFMVNEGDIVVMTIRNESGSAHPMHLHGHHAVVLSRDNVQATGSPWWIDTVDVARDETIVIAFVADNPGIWMDHCHNLTHAAAGLSTHLAYFGVTEPFRVGGDGAVNNQPE